MRPVVDEFQCGILTRHSSHLNSQNNRTRCHTVPKTNLANRRGTDRRTWRTSNIKAFQKSTAHLQPTQPRAERKRQTHCNRRKGKWANLIIS